MDAFAAFAFTSFTLVVLATSACVFKTSRMEIPISEACMTAEVKFETDSMPSLVDRLLKASFRARPRLISDGRIAQFFCGWCRENKP